MSTKTHSRPANRKFAGSKPSSFYSEAYYLSGVGSNYGRKDSSGALVFAPYEEQHYLPRNRQLAKFVVDVYKTQSVLVLGCARAYLVQALCELGVDAKGIDISQWAIRNAPEKIKKHLYVGDICNLSRFKSDSFDCVIGLDVFEHIAVPDLYTALNEAQRVCKETLIIDVPLEKDDLHPDQTSGTDKSHISVYSEGFWIKQFIERSFRMDGKDVYTIIFRKYVSPEPDASVAKSEEKLPVDIIVLNYNGLKFTPKCIETLYKNTDYPFKLIVVDNQSTDGSAEYLNFAKQSYPNMKVIFSETLNSGFAEGVNIGLKESTAPYVLILNNDTLFLQRNWLSLLVEALEKDPRNGLVSPKLLYPDGRIQYAGASFTADMQPYHIGRFKNADSFNLEREVPWATFACALIKRELLGLDFPYEQIDCSTGQRTLLAGLDEAYKLGTFEDVDFCTKARFDGWKILFCPQSIVYHYEGATVFTINKMHYSQQQVANANLFYERWREWLRLNRNAYPELYAEDA
jgi:GT2 family glycosyltransferase